MANVYVCECALKVVYVCACLYECLLVCTCELAHNRAVIILNSTIKAQCSTYQHSRSNQGAYIGTSVLSRRSPNIVSEDMILFR